MNTYLSNFLRKRKEKKLKYINRAIAAGRAKYSFCMATVVSIISSGFATKDFLFSFASLFTIFIIFWACFCVSYFFWPNYIKQAEKIAHDLGTGEVATPPQ